MATVTGLKEARLALALLVLGSILILPFVVGLPEGPGIEILSNSSRSGTAGTILNATGNGTTAGGYIYTVALNATTQSTRWKAFVGNVSGRLVLDDAGANTIFSWELNSTFSGEVYATRYDDSVSWASVNCSGLDDIAEEDIALNLTAQDNISSTFVGQTHSAFQIGTRLIPANNCYSINTYVNDSAQSGSDYFEEILLFDPVANYTVYSTITEQGIEGYNSQRYDFQIILPENGTPSFNSATAYYFYVELV